MPMGVGNSTRTRYWLTIRKSFSEARSYVGTGLKTDSLGSARLSMGRPISVRAVGARELCANLFKLGTFTAPTVCSTWVRHVAGPAINTLKAKSRHTGIKSRSTYMHVAWSDMRMDEQSWIRCAHKNCIYIDWPVGRYTCLCCCVWHSMFSPLQGPAICTPLHTCCRVGCGYIRWLAIAALRPPRQWQISYFSLVRNYKTKLLQ